MKPRREPGARSSGGERTLRDVNEALLVSSVRQHELTEKAQKAEARLQESQNQLRQQLIDTELLRRLSTELVEPGVVESFYERILEAATAIMDSDFASLHAIDCTRGAGDELRLLAHRGMSPESSRYWRWVRGDSESTCGIALRTCERSIAVDVDKFSFSGRAADLAVYREAGIRSAQSTPLLSRGGDLVGMISTHWKSVHQPSERDLRLMDIVARQAADLLERVQEEQKLLASEERYRTIIEQVKDFAIFSTDIRGRATSWNQGVRRVLGFEEADFLGMEAAAIFTPEDILAGVPQRELLEAALNGSACSDRWMQRRDGVRFFANGVTTGLKNAAGDLVGFTRVMRDQTERELFENALQKSEAEARRLLEINLTTTTSMSEGLFTLDAQGLATSVNPEAARMFGWSPDELLGRPMHEVTHYKRADGSPFPVGECTCLQKMREGELLRDFEDAFVRKDGSTFPVSLSSAPLHDSVGTIVGLVVVFRDITERNRVREQLARAAEDLAQMNRRKDEFLAMLSHELRNPLAPILAAVHVLRSQEKGSENPVQEQAREIIERQATHLTRIVNELLEVSRVVSGRIHLRSHVVDLNKILSHAVETTHSDLDARKHTISLHLCDGCAWVNADSTRLEEVFINLLTNAAKYTPDGGHIEVTCEHLLDPDRAQVRVRDNGIGIERDLLEGGRLFELFTQADRSLARSSGGLGVGLSLAHRLVMLHGGSIEVNSPPDGELRGSEFIVRIPLVPAPEQPPSSPARGRRGTPRGQRILLVDDNVDLVTLMAKALRQAGYSVQVAYTGPDGLNAALQWRPDAVLLDIGLPGLDGYQVARRVRASTALGALRTKMRLIAMTGYGRESEIAQARSAGFDAHLTKPVDFLDLEETLTSLHLSRDETSSRQMRLL